MDTEQFMETAISEHNFWLQIMGDHSRFIFFSLAPTETAYIQKAQEFSLAYDQLLNETQNQLTYDELIDLQKKALELTYQLREFKLHLLELSLDSNLKTHLPPTFYNDMLNELDEYLLVMNTLMNNLIPLFHPIHYHMLWLFDAVGHSATIQSGLDLIEKEQIEKAYQYEQMFHDLYLKANTMNGYLRTELMTFPSLDHLNEQSVNAISNFYDFLETLRDHRMDSKVLGTLMPLALDHMAREECYYMWKLSLAAKNIRKPDCDPGRPRLEP